MTRHKTLVYAIDPDRLGTTALTMHEQRKLKDPGFNERMRIYQHEYWLRNKEKLRAYNIERFAKIKAKKLADEQELTQLRKDLND